MKKIRTNMITLIVFVMIIASLAIVNLFAPKADFSDNENRALSPFPSLSLANITSGEFDDGFESWFSDHFVFRDFWIARKTQVRQMIGAIENNGVYFGKDDTLIKAFTTYNEKTLENNISYINEFSEENSITSNIMIIPDAGYGEAELLPNAAYVIDEDSTISNIYEALANHNTVDLRPALREASNDYFKSDHHWNHTGAYIGYQEICTQLLNTEPQEFQYRRVSDSFHGSLYSKSGAFDTPADDLFMMFNENTEGSYLTFEDGSTSASMFIAKNLDIKDQYTYYLDGNHAMVSIHTNQHNGKKAVIVRDSFANILVPYLASEYEELIVIDLRYYHGSVSEHLSDNTDFYVIYSLETFCTDTSLSALW